MVFQQRAVAETFAAVLTDVRVGCTIALLQMIPEGRFISKLMIALLTKEHQFAVIGFLHPHSALTNVLNQLHAIGHIFLTNMTNMCNNFLSAIHLVAQQVFLPLEHFPALAFIRRGFRIFRVVSVARLQVPNQVQFLGKLFVAQITGESFYASSLVKDVGTPLFEATITHLARVTLVSLVALGSGR